MGATQAELERAASAVIVPEFGAGDGPAIERLAALAPVGVHCPASAVEPRAVLARLRSALAEAGAQDCFAACDLAFGTSMPWLDATRLPSALALAAADSGDERSAGQRRWIHGAGAIAGSEARAAGIDLALAPHAEDDLAGFGDDTEHALSRARELVAGLRVAGTDGCLDQHRAHEADACALAPDLARASWPGCLLADGRRKEPSFDGKALARALANGCDGALVAGDPDRIRSDLIAAVQTTPSNQERLSACAARMRALRDRLRSPRARPVGVGEDVTRDKAGFAVAAAEASLCQSRRWSWRLGRPCELLAPLHAVANLDARSFLERLRLDVAGSDRPGGALLPVVSERALEASQLAEIDAKLESLRGLGWPVGLLWLASPRSLPMSWWERTHAPLLVAFDAAAPALAAVQRWLRGAVRASGSLPCNLR